jgi:glutamate carboxypeptidase
VPNVEAGDHLRLEFGRGERQVLLLGHVDTVWPVGQLHRMPLRLEDGRLHGPGIFDMKAGVGLGLLAVRALQRQGLLEDRRVVLLLTSDEEVGSRTSRALVEAEADRSAAALVLEPALPDGGVKTSRKGVGDFGSRCTGGQRTRDSSPSAASAPSWSSRTRCSRCRRSPITPPACR